LGQLHALSEAESKLSVHQRRLSEIEAKVDSEHPFFQNDMEIRKHSDPSGIPLQEKPPNHCFWGHTAKGPYTFYLSQNNKCI